MFNDRVLDRRTPTDWRHIERYPVRRMATEATLAPFERILEIPRQYRDEYDQGTEGAWCGLLPKLDHVDPESAAV